MTCSTHVLDVVLGRPAVGVAVTLHPGAGPQERAETDADGRVRFAAGLAPGVHRLSFATGEWFAAQGRASLHPEVVVAFTVPAESPAGHVHLPLLLSPFSYTTYRGS
ncbi:MAG: hydroxyisourate hydrolase [Thermoleophilia bacterium]